MERKKKQTYCLVCRDYTKSINPKIVRNRQNRYIIQSNCASDQWTASESEKTRLYGNIYDFVVDYEQIVGVKTIDDMHRYLMTKHNIKP